MSGYSAFAKYYDELTENVSYEQRAKYFDIIIKKNIDNAVILLDLACGTGSLSFEFASLGYDVIGVDASEEMLSIAVQKKNEWEELPFTNPMFIKQDMTKLDLYGDVDVAVCALDSLNHLDNITAVDKAFKRLSLFVRSGGLFIFDVNTIYKHQKILSNNAFVYDLDDVFCAWQNFCDENNRVEINLDFFVKNGNIYSRESESFFEQAYSHEVMLELLEKHGFELVLCYGDDSFEPMRDNTQRSIYVARKK